MTNRKERRAMRRIERKARKRGRSGVQGEAQLRGSGEAFPPAYYELVRTLCRLIIERREALRGRTGWEWIEPPDRTVVTGDLGNPDARSYLAANPAADALLIWLDEQTGRKASLYQATCALRFVGEMKPFEGMPEPEVTYQSPALRQLVHLANGTGTTTRMEPSPCPGCGYMMDAATGEPGHAPTPGMFAVCVKCGSISRFDEALRHVPVTEEELAALPRDFQDLLAEHQSLLRQGQLGMPMAPGGDA